MGTPSRRSLDISCSSLDIQICSSYSRIMLWQVDPRDPQPLYEQIAEVVRRAVADQELTAGDRLPAAKELAASLDVNLHTILRAYQQLRDEGHIELRRGRGAVVIAKGSTTRLDALIADLVRQAKSAGISREELFHLIEKQVEA